jgi:hypothetical protein
MTEFDTESGPRESIEKGSNNYLYHMTPSDLVNRIVEEGLVTNMGLKRMEGMVEDDTGRPISKTNKTKVMERLIDRHRPNSVDDRIPNRYGGIFFWDNKRDADRVDIDNTRVIVVDPEKINQHGGVFIPKLISTLNGAIFPKIFGDSPFSDVIEKDADDFWVLSKGKRAPSPIKEFIHGLWEKAELYRGQSTIGREVWFDNDVPPEAIVDVYKPPGTDYETTGNGRLRMEDARGLYNSVREVYHDCTIGIMEGYKMGDVFVVGEYANGSANKKLSEIEVVIKTKSELPRGGRINTLTDQARSDKVWTEVCINLAEQRIVESIKDITIGADVSIVDKDSLLFSKAFDSVVGDDSNDRGVIDLGRKEFITEQEIAERLAKLNPSNLATSIYQMEIDPEGEINDPNRQNEITDEYVEEKYGIDLDRAMKKHKRRKTDNDRI